MIDADKERLIEAARGVREHAHAPYSGFKVGAAVLGRGGNVYLGCNVENASYGATTCAERNAVAAMVAAGEREIAAIVVYTDAEALTPPCGICRQVIHEFGQRAVVVSANPRQSRQFALSALLPEAFTFKPH